mmetsp:Transcript_7822/g.18288  ORF Transcript_7822/g.18288 Transcript_7822/m.18288 type:complete len:526 (+) Transcript_7822:456-2033(+)
MHLLLLLGQLLLQNLLRRRVLGRRVERKQAHELTARLRGEGGLLAVRLARKARPHLGAVEDAVAIDIDASVRGKESGIWRCLRAQMEDVDIAVPREPLPPREGAKRGARRRAQLDAAHRRREVARELLLQQAVEHVAVAGRDVGAVVADVDVARAAHAGEEAVVVHGHLDDAPHLVGTLLAESRRAHMQLEARELLRRLHVAVLVELGVAGGLDGVRDARVLDLGARQLHDLLLAAGVEAVGLELLAEALVDAAPAWGDALRLAPFDLDRTRAVQEGVEARVLRGGGDELAHRFPALVAAERVARVLEALELRARVDQRRGGRAEVREVLLARLIHLGHELDRLRRPNPVPRELLDALVVGGRVAALRVHDQAAQRLRIGLHRPADGVELGGTRDAELGVVADFAVDHPLDRKRLFSAGAREIFAPLTHTRQQQRVRQQLAACGAHVEELSLALLEQRRVRRREICERARLVAYARAACLGSELLLVVDQAVDLRSERTVRETHRRNAGAKLVEVRLARRLQRDV